MFLCDMTPGRRSFEFINAFTKVSSCELSRHNLHCTDYTGNDLPQIIDSQRAPFFTFLLDLRSDERNIRFGTKLSALTQKIV